MSSNANNSNASKRSNRSKKNANGKEMKWVKKEKNNPARDLARKEGQRGIDSRAQSVSAEPEEKEMVSDMTDVSIDARATFDQISIQSLALGPVLLALRKGWLNQTTDGGTSTPLGLPYFAYVKLFQSFVTAMQGTAPVLQNAPKWYWHITQALTSKILNYKTGRLTLNWDVPEGLELTVPSYDFAYPGGFATLRIAQFGVPEVDGFIPLVNPAPYTDDAGSRAIKNLFQFYKAEGMNELVPTYSTPCAKTGSAFSVCSAEIGAASGSSGGIISTIYSEVAIQMPILAKFAIYQPVQYRGWQRIQVSGGSPCYTIPRMIEFTDKRQLYNQMCPQFKYYNFDEFFEVLSIAVGAALEKANAQPVSGGALLTTCPLTSQQVRLLLRHTLMRRFYNHLAQDLVMSGSGLLSLSPFSAAVNGTSTTQTNMLLPLLLAENIRATGRKQVRLGKTQSVIDYVPILARPTEFPEPTGYQFDTTDGPVPVYSTNPDETPINVVDLSYSLQGNPIEYLTLEGATIVSLCNRWNTWISSLGSYLTPLTDPGLEKGLNAFSLSLTSCHSKYVPPVPQLPELANNRLLKKRESVEKKKFIGINPETIRQTKVSVTQVTSSDYFQNVQPVSITTTNQPLEPIVKYTKVLIAPAIISNDPEPEQAATPSAQQIFRIEPYRIPLNNLPSITGATNDGQQTMFGRHYQMALMDVRVPLQPASEMENELVALSVGGRGGFFTSIAGMFAEDVLGIKGGKQIASAIGSATGL